MPRITYPHEDFKNFVNYYTPSRLCGCGGKVRCLIAREDEEVWRCENCFKRYDTQQFFDLREMSPE